MRKMTTCLVIAVACLGIVLLAGMSLIFGGGIVNRLWMVLSTQDFENATQHPMRNLPPPRDDGLVTLMPPYLDWRWEKEELPRIGLEKAVIAVCYQAGMRYNWEISEANIGKMRFLNITPVIENMEFEDAMQEIVAGTNTSYEVKNNIVVLTTIYSDVDPIKRPTTLRPPYLRARQRDDPQPRISVQYAVMNLGTQVGLRYDFGESMKNTRPRCWKWIYDLTLEDVPFEDAVKQILDPVDLTYYIEDGTIVLVRADGKSAPSVITEKQTSIAMANSKRTVSLKPPFTGWNPNKHDAADVISLTDAVSAVCNQAGIAYDYADSRNNIGDFCDSKISPVIDRRPWDDAMETILDPLGLAYIIKDDQVVLITNADKG